MSSDIQPGDVVVCVDVGPGKWGFRPARNIAVGKIYKVATTGVHMDEPAVTLVGVIADTDTGLYGAFRFRKLNDGTDDAELIVRIKSCQPVKQDA